jgi:hypothetical protein
VLGDEHPDTLVSANNLADAYTTAGRLDAAVPLLERTLADRRRILGDHHPQTVISAGNLAGAYFLDGHRDRALALAEQAHTTALRALGLDHPQTLKMAQLLAVLPKPGRAADPRDDW